METILLFRSLGFRVQGLEFIRGSAPIENQMEKNMGNGMHTASCRGS